MCDRFGVRVDEILYPSDHCRLLEYRYWAGVLWRLFGEKSLLPLHDDRCATVIYDPGFACH
jgi:hypothetical protein